MHRRPCPPPPWPTPLNAHQLKLLAKATAVTPLPPKIEVVIIALEELRYFCRPSFHVPDAEAPRCVLRRDGLTAPPCSIDRNRTGVPAELENCKGTERLEISSNPGAVMSRTLHFPQ